MSDVKKTSAKRGRGRPFTGQPGPGRPKGVPNKFTMDVKQMILAALDKAGGADYLYEQAKVNPGAFMTLVGKTLPLTHQGDPSRPLEVAVRFE